MSRFKPIERVVSILIFLTALQAASALAQNTIRVPADAATIQAGIDAAQNGDTVLVSPGTYNENLDFKGKAITVTSGATSFAGAGRTVVSGLKDGPVVIFGANEPAAAVLNGFTVRDGHASPATGLFGQGISIVGASPTITNNIVTNNMDAGIQVSNNASPLIEGNDIRLTSGTGLILVNAGSVQVIGNTIEENDNTGGSTCSSSGVSILSGVQLLLKNNIVRNNRAACDSGFGDAITAPPSSLLLIQNLFYGNTGGGAASPIQVFVSGTMSTPFPSLTETNNTIYGLGQELVLSLAPSTIANNILVESDASQLTDIYGGLWCADAEAKLSPLSLVYNDIFNAGPPIPTDCTVGAGSLSVAPTFVAPISGDFHEQKASPTVAAGDLAAPDLPTADLAGKARTTCGVVDMGAYQWHPSPPIALTTSANPAPGGSPLTFTARLTGNCNVPTGTVAFLDGNISFGTAAVDNSGVARLTTSFLVVGLHNISASYPGDFNFEASASNIVAQTITGDATTTTIAVSPNPAAAFSPIALSSMTQSPYLTPNGSVVFMAGGVTLATATLDGSGRASAVTTALGAGSYSITADYQATTLFHASSSAPAQETVVGANSLTTLTASPNPAAVGQTVAFAATVRAVQGAVTPSGKVTFLDGAASLGSAALNAKGLAVFNISTLGHGSHAITARYEGSADFNPSSATLTEAVNLIATGLTLTAAPNPANNGQAVTLTATARAMFAGTVAQGVVTFRDGAAILGTATLDSGGVAKWTANSLEVGTHPLQAALAGNSSFAASTSPEVDEVVLAYDFTIALSKGSVSLPSGDWTILTVTLTPVGGFTGSVTLGCSGVPDHAQCAFPQGATASLAKGVKTVELGINTSDVYGYGRQVSSVIAPPGHGEGVAGVAFAAMLLPAFGFWGLWSRRRGWLRNLCLAVAALVVILGTQSCGGKIPAKTAPGAYTITVAGSASSGTPLRHASKLNLVVTP